MPHEYLFFDDYSEGAHPRILEALATTNVQQERGYGTDSFTQEAERLVKEKINKPQAHVHFVPGGTHANLICLASMLQPFQSVIAAETGHINHHEAGAIEATGHKINLVSPTAGKLTAESVEKVVMEHAGEHAVQPRVVYISQATELGTVYRKNELEDLRHLCNQHNLLLYLDGARIGNALAAKRADLHMSDIADLCDAMYIGGTKNGALCGEAIILVNQDLQENFRSHLKQRGALLAKGRALGVQFMELFKDDLYMQNAMHANTAAQKLADGIHACGYTFVHEPETNQIFPIFPNTVIESLQQRFGFYTWASVDDTHSSVRLVTSWATPDRATEAFIERLNELSKK